MRKMPDEEDDSLTDDEEKKRISKVRRESRNKQWENAAKKEQIKEAIREEKLASKAGGAGDIKKPPSKGKVSSWKMELEGILPRCFEQQLIMLGMVSKHFPESSPIAIVNPGLIGREGKSEFYRKLQTVRKFLEPIPVKAELLLSWACDLALTDYEQFKAHGLSFSDERDIPVTVLIREKSENIKAEVWGNFRREDIRRLTLDHMIRVYQVAYYPGNSDFVTVVTVQAVDIELKSWSLIPFSVSRPIQSKIRLDV